MSKPVAALVSTYELETVEAYILGKEPPSYLSEFFDALEVPSDAEASSLQIAVAQIVLRQIGKTLPRALTTYPNGKRIWSRVPTKKLRTTEPLSFEPKLIFGINWADSAPGASWPETYHATHIAGFNYYIVTASRGTEEPWGCSDHAIGSFSAKTPIAEGAGEIITQYWRRHAADWCQARWADFWNAGLLDRKVAYQWAEEVWGEEVEPSDDWRSGDRS